MITPTGTDINLSDLAIPTPKADASRQLGQDEFLTLMITQLQHQDPMAPMENGEFIAQMAQFSTVEGISEMSKSLGGLTDSMYATQVLQASTMIGHSVLVDGDRATLEPDKPLQGAVEVPFPTSAASVQIFDGAGQVVRSIDLEFRNSGPATFEWDGRLDGGAQAPPGIYRIAGVLDTGGDQQALATYTAARVQSVAMTSDGRGAQITTDTGEEVSLTQVKAIM
ncbi:MAG: flagellar hook assembly protein FlgD [Gammaproteobacteria bacterium]